MSDFFRFKQFQVQDRLSAMKVGTDAVLLGAWAEIRKNQSTALDIGTGTGLIALMLAQRSMRLKIDAIDIEASAFQEASINFHSSPWNDRLEARHSSLQTFNSEIKFDLVISNPPFFEFNFHSIDAERTLARRQNKLTFEELLQYSKCLMSSDASCHYIIPFYETDCFLKLASHTGLYPYRICYVKGNEKARFKRTLISLSQKKKNLSEEELIIEMSRHNYTDEYLDLVKDFYLNM